MWGWHDHAGLKQKWIRVWNREETGKLKDKKVVSFISSFDKTIENNFQIGIDSLKSGFENNLYTDGIGWCEVDC